MNHADTLVGEGNDVHVGARQRVAKFCERQVWQRDNIGGRFSGHHVVDLPLDHSPADEHELQPSLAFQLLGGGQERAKRGRVAVVARIHHDKRIAKALPLPKRIAIVGQILTNDIVRPGWHDVDFFCHVGLL